MHFNLLGGLLRLSFGAFFPQLWISGSFSNRVGLSFMVPLDGARVCR